MQKGQWNKKWQNKNLVGTHGGTKNGGDPQPLGGRGTPSHKCKKVSGTKNCGTKIGGTKIGRIKIWWGTLGHWVVGTPSASAKRSAKQKMMQN